MTDINHRAAALVWLDKAAQLYDYVTGTRSATNVERGILAAGIAQVHAALDLVDALESGPTSSPPRRRGQLPPEAIHGYNQLHDEDAEAPRP